MRSLQNGSDSTYDDSLKRKIFSKALLKCFVALTPNVARGRPKVQNQLHICTLFDKIHKIECRCVHRLTSKKRRSIFVWSKLMEWR